MSAERQRIRDLHAECIDLIDERDRVIADRDACDTHEAALSEIARLLDVRRAGYADAAPVVARCREAVAERDALRAEIDRATREVDDLRRDVGRATATAETLRVGVAAALGCDARSSVEALVASLDRLIAERAPGTIARLAGEVDALRARLTAHEALAAAARAHFADAYNNPATSDAMARALRALDATSPEAWPATGIVHAGRWWHRADGAWEWCGAGLHGVGIATPADARRAMGQP